MIRYVGLAVMLCVAHLLSAQNVSDTAEYHLSTEWWQIGIGSFAVKDAYLSPLDYTGTGLTLKFNDKSFFLNNSEKYISSLSGNLNFSSLLNPARTAAMTYLGINADYGVHDALHPTPQLLLLIGASIDIDLAFKYLARNTNNPFNADAAVNLNLSAAAQWNIKMLHRVCQAELALRTPFAGIMFVPDVGESYYELFSISGNAGKTFHLSSFGNKQGGNVALAFDFPLNHFTVRLSGNGEYLRYKVNNAFYSRSINSISIGCKYDLFIFSGRKSAPKNFISPNNF